MTCKAHNKQPTITPDERVQELEHLVRDCKSRQVQSIICPDAG